MELAPDGRIAPGHGTLVSDVSLSPSEWDVSRGPYACLSQIRLLGRDLAKATAKLVEHPELVADRIITFMNSSAKKTSSPAPTAATRPRLSANRLGQAARRRGDREQEVVELNSRVPVRDERNKKQENLEVKV